MATIISGDTGIDKITDGSVVAADISTGAVGATQLASTLDLSSKTVTLATDAAVVSKLSTASGSAPSYSARAWVSLNGTGTIAINGSGNVSSIVDVGTGQYTVNLTTAIQDVNYAVTVGGSVLAAQTSNEKTFNAANITTSSFMIHSHDSTSNAYADSVNVFGAVFR